MTTMTTNHKTRRVRIIADSDPQNPREDYDNFGTMVCNHRRYDLGDVKNGDADELAVELAKQCTDIALLRQIVLDDVKGNAHHREYYKHILQDFRGYIDDDHRNVFLEYLDGMRDSQGTWDRLTPAIEAVATVLPLYLYDHSGITMRTSAFSCPWDSGQVGVIYVTLDKARKEFVLDDSATWDTLVNWHDGEQITLREACERNLKHEVEAYDQYLTGDIYGFIVEELTEGGDPEDDDDWTETDSCWGFYGSDIDDNGMAEHLGEELAALARKAEIEYD